jgi:hypothetical protein
VPVDRSANTAGHDTSMDRALYIFSKKSVIMEHMENIACQRCSRATRPSRGKESSKKNTVELPLREKHTQTPMRNPLFALIVFLCFFIKHNGKQRGNWDCCWRWEKKNCRHNSNRKGPASNPARCQETPSSQKSAKERDNAKCAEHNEARTGLRAPRRQRRGSGKDSCRLNHQTMI